MSLRSVEGNDLRELRPVGKDHGALRADVGRGLAPIDGKGGMRTESPRTFTADAHGEIRALLDVFRPRVAVHGEPLGGNVVEHEKEKTARREDAEEADPLLVHGPPVDAFQAALDKGPAAIVREEAESAEPGLDKTPKERFVY